MFTPRIAICGAGPAGLILGILLHKQNIPFTIFDLREKPSEDELSQPAGSLDLHEESGLAALKACGLLEKFAALTGDCTEAQRVADKTGTILHADSGTQSNRPEISRHKLIHLLLTHLPSAHIKWSHKLLSTHKTPASSSSSSTSSITLNFGPLGKQTFDLLIGADGAWSQARGLLTGIKPTFAGVHNITLNIRALSEKHPRLAELVGSGTFNALGEGHMLGSQRSVGGSTRLYVFLSSADENFACSAGLAGKTPGEARDVLLGEKGILRNWGSELRELVDVACEDEECAKPGEAVDIRGIYYLPVGCKWVHDEAVTLVGDAAHLMPPWAGEGVNLAMLDAMMLAEALGRGSPAFGGGCRGARKGDGEAQNGDGEALEGDGEFEGHGESTPMVVKFREACSPWIRDFEEKMWAKAEVEARGTMQNGEMMFGDDAALNMARFFESVHEPEAVAEGAGGY